MKIFQINDNHLLSSSLDLLLIGDKTFNFSTFSTTVLSTNIKVLVAIIENDRVSLFQPYQVDRSEISKSK